MVFLNLILNNASQGEENVLKMFDYKCWSIYKIASQKHLD